MLSEKRRTACRRSTYKTVVSSLPEGPGGVRLGQMKRMLLGFIAGLAVGAFALWYYEDGWKQDRGSTGATSERIKTTVQEKVGDIRTDDIKRELERAGLVVR